MSDPANPNAVRPRLPNRRHCLRGSVRWPPVDGRRIYVDIGFGDDLIVREVFFRGGGRVASEIDNALDDAAKAISLACQFGCPLWTIAATLGRDESGLPASMIGAAVDEALRMARSLTLTVVS
jgi:hypothetical protein